MPVEGMLLAYHIAGGTFLKNVKKYTTHHADKYNNRGPGRDLITKFTNNFGDIFDNNSHKITNYIDERTITIADIRFNIIPTDEAYDIEIPEINSIYTHMLGSNCHSIITSVEHAKSMIVTLKEYISKNYNLILTSHYIPEDINAVKAKISYIENLLNIAKDSSNAKDFIDKVKTEYPNYNGVNYLEMTANCLFNK